MRSKSRRRWEVVQNGAGIATVPLSRPLGMALFNHQKAKGSGPHEQYCRTAILAVGVLGPAALASPGNLVERQILRTYPRYAERKILWMGSRNLCFNGPSENSDAQEHLRTIVLTVNYTVLLVRWAFILLILDNDFVRSCFLLV